MELLERDEALGALAEAHAAAARGDGRVVVVTGEAGIGKTSLVNRFLRDHGAGTRVLFGSCDDLSIPRPLGPLYDFAGAASPQLETALSGGAEPHQIHDLLIAGLREPPSPTVLVLEDIHWADHATLDVITVLARRIGSLPVLLLLTCRDGEAPPAHPVHAAVGATRPDDSAFLALTPLSETAVASLAGDCAEDVYAATGGNPFFVAELLASPTTADLPPSVATAVLGRASRLDEDSRRLVELVSVVPNRVPTSVLDAVMPDWAAAAEEPERRQLLEVDERYVHFRHELARNAIRSSIPIAGRRRLHAAILEALLAADADPADIVHHAEAAGAEEVVAEHALVAARRASALGSNREAYSHYRRASHFVDRRPVPEQAAVLEELSRVAYAVGRLEDAFPAIERATALYEELGDRLAVARCKRALSRFHWYAGDGDCASRSALEAVAILEPLGESVELAHAYSVVSQLAMLSEDTGPALEWGERALGLATRLGDDSARVHVLVNIGSARIDVDGGVASALLEAHAAADRVGDRHEAARALVNLAYAMQAWVQPAAARGYAEQALAYAREHEVDTLAAYCATLIAWLRLRAGEWAEAEAVTRTELGSYSSVLQLLVKTVLAELAVRRGDPDAAERLDDITAQAERTDEVQRIAPVLELATERALTDGAPLPRQGFEKALAEIRKRGSPPGWAGLRLEAWAPVVGIEGQPDERMSAPHAAMVRRDWLGAADAYGEVGWSYDRALMLSLLDDQESLTQALELARGLGAEPLTRRVAGRLRELGLRVPAGPREATRSNPAGLTARQLEVLELLAEGLTNTEIAERLVVSPRTAEHHVAAVLRKLGAATRRAAVRRAAELELVGPS
ncbi:MAG TPA: AAA family ATPase [Gaiellaceae bacterium]|nr:AAA family ATPase [Gaiellaceae bacterium]